MCHISNLPVKTWVKQRSSITQMSPENTTEGKTKTKKAGYKRERRRRILFAIEAAKFNCTRFTAYLQSTSILSRGVIFNQEVLLHKCKALIGFLLDYSIISLQKIIVYSCL